MTNKVQKIREEVEKLKSQLLRCACSSQIAMETRCKEEAYNEVLAILDTMQEESIDYDKLNTMLNDALSKETKESWNEMLGKEKPVSDFEMALTEMIDKAQKCVVEPWAIAAQWKDELIKLAKSEEPVSEIDFEQELYKAFGHIKDFTLGMRIASRFYEMGRNHQEPVSEDLGEYINELSKQFPEVSFAKLSRIAVRVAKWQEDQFEKNRLAACDRQTQEEAKIELDFVMSIIEKEYRQPTFDDAIKYGMRLQRENMMRKATEVTVHIDAGNYPYIPQIELYDYEKDIPLAKEGDKYKVVLIKEE